MLISLHITHSSAGGMTSLGDIIPALNDALNAELPSCDYCDEYVIIRTCNRLEAYVSTKNMDGMRRMLDSIVRKNVAFSDREVWYVLEDKDCIKHLFTVICGIDSLIVGEDQIQHQTKDAFVNAQKEGHVGRALYSLFNNAIVVGKRVRAETELNKGAVSVGYAAIELAEQRIGTLEGKNIAIIGAGDMAGVIAKNLAGKGPKTVIVSNRTFQRAQELAKELEGTAIGFDRLSEIIAKSDLVLVATSAKHNILDKDKVADAIKDRPSDKPLEVDLPKGRLTVVTGVSGSGKTTLVLESLLPAIKARSEHIELPDHINSVACEGIEHAKLIDATPIGINVRSTVATYSGIHDDLRKLFSKTEAAIAGKYKAGDFSYNTGKLRCSACDGTGEIDLDVQFLPDVTVPCTCCNGTRYSEEAAGIRYTNKNGESASISELMDMDVYTAKEFFKDHKSLSQKLSILSCLGLGYLTLGEETPGLSGGEAQRLKLATELGKTQDDSLFIFDEPTIGLHPLDVQVLMDVIQSLIGSGATVVMIEHDREVIRNADYIIDMGPGGGIEGGTVVACGTPEDIRKAGTLTGKFI